MILEPGAKELGGGRRTRLWDKDGACRLAVALGRGSGPWRSAIGGVLGREAPRGKLSTDSQPQMHRLTHMPRQAKVRWGRRQQLVGVPRADGFQEITQVNFAAGEFPVNFF